MAADEWRGRDPYSPGPTPPGRPAEGRESHGPGQVDPVRQGPGGQPGPDGPGHPWNAPPGPAPAWIDGAWGSTGGYGDTRGRGPEGPQRTGWSLWAIIGVVLAAVAAASLLGTGLYLLLGTDRSAPAPTPRTSTVVATPTGSRGADGAGPSRAPAPTASPASSRPPGPTPPPEMPAGARFCGKVGPGAHQQVAAGTSITSCEFALSVQSTYAAQAKAGDAAVLVALSPVTGRSYTMTCSAGQVVTCRGGNDAVVHIY